MRLKAIRAISLLLMILLLAGCGAAPAETEKEVASTGSDPAAESEPAYVDKVAMEYTELEDEAVALEELPEAALPKAWETIASGEKEKKNAKAVIDYSNTDDGYVMVKYTATTKNRLKVVVAGPKTSYTYNLTAGEWTAFSLSDGNGSYRVIVYENVKGTSYAAVLSLSAAVTMTDEFVPFTHSNQYVDFAEAPNTIAKAAELVKGIEDPLKKVEAVYDFVVKGLTYDKEKAATVKSGYLPDLDKVLEEKKGICFDYAALMTGMLRSQGVPCKLVVGYAGDAYHAWISVWSAESGWVDGAIYFDGAAWQRMDPTFASSGKQSASIMAYIGDGKNYSAKYLY